MFSSVLTAKGQKGAEGLMGPKGLRGRPGRPGPAIFFDSSEEVITIKGEKVEYSPAFSLDSFCNNTLEWEENSAVQV